MHIRSLRRSTAAIALATAAAVGVSLTPVPSTLSFVAAAQSADTMPVNYYYVPAADAAAYEAEVKTFAAVTRLRHVYHQAAYDAKYENYYGATAAIRAAADRAEYNCFVGKARLSLALLKIEGNEAARALDLTRVGLDLDTTTAAIAVLEPATIAARDAAWNADSTDPDRAKKNSRHGIFQDGLGRLKSVKQALEAGEPTYEYDAFSVINWNTESRYVEAKLAEHHIPAEIAQQVVANIEPNDNVDTAAIAKAAAENRAYLAGLFGEFSSAPKPPVETSPAPTTPPAESSPAPTTPAPTTPAEPSAPAETSAPKETTTSQAPAPTTSQAPAPSTSEAPAPSTAPEPAPQPEKDKTHPVLAFFLRIFETLGLLRLINAIKGLLGSS